MKQSKALEVMNSGVNVFLTGPPGSGKSYVIENFIEQSKSRGREVAVTATTGIAASIIGGITIHSWAGLFNNHDRPDKKFRPKVYDRIRRTDILIIDEVSMLSDTWLSRLDQILKSIRENRKALGGLQVILSGDFFQLPPISKAGASSYAFKAPVWHDLGLHVCYLTEQHRQSGDGLLGVLNAMRSASLNAKHLGLLLNRQIMPDRDITALLTHNRDVEKLNHERLDKLAGEVYVYEMAMTGSAEAIKELRRSVIAPDKLYLKVGAKVMFTANDLTLGYANGTIGTVTGFRQGLPIIEIIDKKLKIKVEPKEWKGAQSVDKPAAIYQLPIRLAWAVTIHKCQGMSLDEAEVDLSRSFTYGMGYVALSRLKNLQGLYLRGFNSRSLEMDPEVAIFDTEIRHLSDLIEAESGNKAMIEYRDLAILLYEEGVSKKFIKLSTGLSEAELKKILK